MFKKQQGIEYIELRSKSGQQRTFTKVKYLGSGGFARCYEVYEQLQGMRQPYAVKIIKKSTLYQTKQLIERLRTEIRLHKKFSEQSQCNHVVRFLQSFQTQDYIYLLLELCVNQTLNELIRRRKFLSEEETRFFILELAHGLKQVHSKNVVHRDIKLCNLFLSKGLNIKIGDFGLATEIKDARKRFTVCGTANYVAPQMIHKDANGNSIGHAYEVDVWALGVVCYTIYYGRYPFQSQEEHQIYNKILACKYSFNPYTMKEMKQLNINALNHFPSDQLKAFIKAIFEIDPAKRLTLDQVFQHPFITKTNVPKELPDTVLKCHLKKQTMDKLFTNKNQQQNQQNYKAIISTTLQNKNQQQANQNKKQTKNQIQNKICKQTQQKEGVRHQSFIHKSNKRHLISQNIQETQHEQKFKIQNQKMQNKNQKGTDNSSQRLYFKFQRKISRSLEKRRESNWSQMHERQQNSLESLPKTTGQHLLLQVIIQKGAISSDTLSKQKNAFMIKVYYLKESEMKDKANNFSSTKGLQSQYSIIVHPRLDYLTKIFERSPLQKVDKVEQSNKQKEMYKNQQQKFDGNTRTVLKIPLTSPSSASMINQNHYKKKYEEEFYIVKMVYKYLDQKELNQITTQQIIQLETPICKEIQKTQVNYQLANLQDIVPSQLAQKMSQLNLFPQFKQTQQSLERYNTELTAN